VPRPDRRGRMTRRRKDTAIVSSSMSSLFIGWLARAGQKASQHLTNPVFLCPDNRCEKGLVRCNRSAKRDGGLSIRCLPAERLLMADETSWANHIGVCCVHHTPMRLH